MICTLVLLKLQKILSPTSVSKQQHAENIKYMLREQRRVKEHKNTEIHIVKKSIGKDKRTKYLSKHTEEGKENPFTTLNQCRFF